MKLMTTLPEWKMHFQSIQTDTEWRYVWQHKGSYLLRVCSQILHPWGKDCVIRIKEQKYKTTNIKFTKRIDLTILDADDIENAVPGRIIMEAPFPGIPHSDQPTLRFYAIPCTEKKDMDLNIMLSVISEVK